MHHEPDLVAGGLITGRDDQCLFIEATYSTRSSPTPGCPNMGKNLIGGDTMFLKRCVKPRLQAQRHTFAFTGICGLSVTAQHL